MPTDRPEPHRLLERAETIAESVLFPAALAVDQADRVPEEHLARLVADGIYGAAGPVDAGGAGLDGPTFRRVVETLAAGCLTTTFVWIQHQGVVRRLRTAAPALGEAWLEPLCRGERRGGVALGGCLPGPPVLHARRVDGGWHVDGHSPWVTGWGMVDVLLVAARTADDELVWGLTDPAAGPSLAVERQPMVAVNASATVDATFTRHLIPDEQVAYIQPFAEFQAQDPRALVTNGFLATGLARRCLHLLGPSPLDAELERCRRSLDEGTAETFPAARADAAALAVRAATALLVGTGSRSILTTQHAQRLAREAMFICVFGSRPAIKEGLLARFTG